MKRLCSIFLKNLMKLRSRTIVYEFDQVRIQFLSKQYTGNIFFKSDSTFSISNNTEHLKIREIRKMFAYLKKN